MIGQLRRIVRYGVSVILLLLFWWTVTIFSDVPKYILPSPSSVFGLLVREPHFYWAATVYTTKNAFWGALIGISLGFGTGVALAFFRSVRWVTEPYLVIFQSFPREALAPVIIVWLGFGTQPKVAMSALLCYFPMALVTLNSVSHTRSDYLELVRSWGATRRQEFWYCRLPASVPTLIGLQRVCLPLALVGSVLGEFMGGSHGLGYIVMSAGSVTRLDRVFVAVLILGVIGTFVLGLVNIAQHTILKRFEKE